MSDTLLSDAVQLLKAVLDCLQKYSCASEAELLQRFLCRYERGEFHLAIVGACKRGKSTLINALLGEEVVPVAAPPATKRIIYLQHGRRYGVRSNPHGRKIRQFRHSRALYSYLSDAMTATQDTDITATIPGWTFPPGLVLVDTPGVDEAHEYLTHSVLSRMDGVVFVFGVREQYDTEFQFFKQAAEDLPALCVVNRIDEPNTRADLEQNLEHLRKNLGTVAQHIGRPGFEPEPVSGHLGLRAKQWKRRPRQFAQIRADDRTISRYATKSPDELLLESRLPQFEAALQAWLQRRLNWQLWRGMRLARACLREALKKAQGDLAAAKQEEDQQLPQIQHALEELSWRERKVRIAQDETERLLGRAISRVWQEAICPTTAAEVEEVKQAVHRYLGGGWASDYKEHFCETANATWAARVANIERAAANQLSQVSFQVEQKMVQEGSGKTSSPDFNLSLSSNIRQPWPRRAAPGSDTQGTAEILESLHPPEGGIGRGLFNLWHWALSGLEGRLQRAFDNELTEIAAILSQDVRRSVEKWQERFWQSCQQTYGRELSAIDQERANLEGRKHALKQAILEQSERVQRLTAGEVEFLPQLDLLGQALLEAPPIQLPVSQRKGGFRLVWLFLLALFVIGLIVIVWTMLR